MNDTFAFVYYSPKTNSVIIEPRRKLNSIELDRTGNASTWLYRQMQKKENKYKPCPFCGGLPEVGVELKTNGDVYYIQCEDDYCEVEVCAESEYSLYEAGCLWQHITGE